MLSVREWGWERLGSDEFEEMRNFLDRVLTTAAGPRSWVVPVPQDSLPSDPEVLAGDREMYVTWDLGEASPREVVPHVSGRLIRLRTLGARPAERVVAFPDDVAGIVRWTIRNGVLDLVVARRPKPE